MSELLRELMTELADESGKIVSSPNTSRVIEDAYQAGIVEAISGEFRCHDSSPGVLWSVYRMKRP